MNNHRNVNKPHHGLKGFCNSEPFNISWVDVYKWHKQRRILPPKQGYPHFIQQWFTPANFNQTGDQVWWLGHATTLVRINDKTVLTDPVFSDRLSPIKYFGPMRRTPCGSQIEQLPCIDFITISHNHYDHLDYPSIKQLIQYNPHVIIIVPLGLKGKLLQWGAIHVIELDWWQAHAVDNMCFTAVPAQHWSRRSPFDINKSLWCGFMLQHQHKTLYFMGDTGYSRDFLLIAQRFPKIDLALIPIGCYAPRWFMHNQHIDPAQALTLFHEIGCQKALAIHWGTFELADEPLDEPPQLLTQLLENEQLNTPFHIIKIGQSIGW